MHQETRACQSCHREFRIDPEDFDFYKKISVPPPTWCPMCRAVRRASFWNMSNLYRKKDVRTGQEIFSTYPEEADIQIYDRDYWWSDSWDPLAYGKAVDFSRPFLAQVDELNKAVPWPSKSVRGMVASEYCNQASYLKNCYLCFNGNDGEDSMYCVSFVYTHHVLDAYAVTQMELSYEIYQGDSSSRCFFSSDISGCRDVWYSRDCTDCSDCFGCVNLRHKQYCIWNKQYTKEAYLEELEKMNRGSYAASGEFARKLQELYVRVPHKYMHGLGNTNVSGDYAYWSKDARDVYEVGNLEHVRYSENLMDGNDSRDYTNWGQTSELVYESASVGDSCRNVKFCFDCWPAVRDSEYSINCHSSSNLFGCVGLGKKQYCILNRQYAKEEYETLVLKIKAHMDAMPYVDAQGRIYRYGEFFPPEFSPLAYNETVALDYYPKTEAEAVALGYAWRNARAREFNPTMEAADLPDHVKDAPDAAVKEIIRCDSCKKSYRILDRELAFLRRFGVPLPRKCHRCRYAARLAIRNPRGLYRRPCQCAGVASSNGVYKNTAAHSHGAGKCPNEFETSYAPERAEIVYCEACYNAEVA